MLVSYLLALREGLEAALIIGAILGALYKLERSEGRRYVWMGMGAAILLSLVTGYLLHLAGANFEGRAEDIFEGITMLLAASIITWVLLWMRNQSRLMRKKLESDVVRALELNSGWALFFLAFLSVIREGIELAFFLTAATVDNSVGHTLIGAGLGLGTTVALAILLYNSLIRLNLARFFQVTSLILVLFAAGLVAHGVHEFNEVGLIPPIIDHVWDTNQILDENSPFGQLIKSLLGYNGNPSLSEVVAYVFYIAMASMQWAFSRKRNLTESTA